MINQKIIKLASAIQEYEGWAPQNHPAAKDGGPTISYRNHNPGNLRFSIFQLGVRNGFSVFYSDDIGFFAMCFDLMYKAQNKSRYINAETATLRELIRIWSNTKDKALENYVNFVSKRTGFSEDLKIKELVR